MMRGFNDRASMDTRLDNNARYIEQLLRVKTFAPSVAPSVAPRARIIKTPAVR